MRRQFRRTNTLNDNEVPLEGEPVWDSINRRIGFWNFPDGEYNWFRIPKTGENDNYIPEHEWDGTVLKFRNPDGTWDHGTDLKGVGVDNVDIINNPDGTITLRFFVGGVPFETITGVLKGDKGDPGGPPLITFSVDFNGDLIFQLDSGGIDPITSEITDEGELVINYGIA